MNTENKKKILSPEELEKKRAKQREYNHAYVAKHNEEVKALQRKLYKEKTQNKEYYAYLYNQQKIARKILKQKKIEANLLPPPKKRGRPTTLPFFKQNKQEQPVTVALCVGLSFHHQQDIMEEKMDAIKLE
jgi:hypothetical protein